MVDVDIHEFLAADGFGHSEALAAARSILHEAGLSRPGRQRMAVSKVEKARLALRSRLIVTCANRPCVEAASRLGQRLLVPAHTRGGCDVCGGSDNAYAIEDMVRAAIGGGICRLVVVGGSPATREELATLVDGRLHLRLIDGTARRTTEQARHDLVWADLVVIWASTQLAHSVSLLYVRRSGRHTPVITVARRGVAALAEALVGHMRMRNAKSTASVG